jgi:transposase
MIDINWQCELCGYDENPQELSACELCGLVENRDIKISDYSLALNIEQKETA